MSDEVEISEGLIAEIKAEIDLHIKSLLSHGERESYAFVAERAIRRILSAVRNGEQKIPGEVGRGKAGIKKGGLFQIIGDDCECPSGWRLEKCWIQSFGDLHDVDTLSIIALRVEEK